MLTFRVTLVVAASIASGASAAELPAIVHKPVVDVRAQPAFDAPKVATLQRDTAVTVSAQQGLWYALRMPADATGYVRVNDVRLAYAGVEDGAANVRVLMGGKAGHRGKRPQIRGIRPDAARWNGRPAGRRFRRIRIRRRTRLASDQRGLRW